MDISYGRMKIFIKGNLKAIKKKDLVYAKLKIRYLWECGKIIF